MAGHQPAGSWYREVGQGMGKTLQIANEVDAYTITDRGTWLAYEAELDIQLVFAGDPPLFNPYGIIAVNPKRHSHVNFAGAQQLINWITSPEAQKMIKFLREEMGVEKISELFRRSAVKGAGLGLELVDLPLAPGDRLLQAFQFRGDLGARNLVLGHLDLAGFPHMGRPDGHAGRDGEALQDELPAPALPACFVSLH